VTAPTAHPQALSAGPPAASEISALIAWMRRLSDLGAHRADPAEVAAFLLAKRDLLARIELCNHPRPPLMTKPGDPVD
jgi:hypothetical protein